MEVEMNQMMKESAAKILSVLKYIFDEKILDVNTKIPAKWNFFFGDTPYKMLPWIGLMMAGYVPSIITNTIRYKDYLPQFFRYILKSIFMNQTENPLMMEKKEDVAVFIDEINGIANSENKGVAGEIIETVVRESGPARISFIYAAQNYDRVLTEVRLNTGYVFCFTQKSDWAKMVAKDFGLEREYVPMLTRLKRFECVALTRNYFVVYDTSGNVELTDKPQYGKILPPLSSHQKPIGENNG